MQTPTLFSLLLVTFAPSAFAIDWLQPPVGCVEEVMIQAPEGRGFYCPDLSQTLDPWLDFPADMTSDEIAHLKKFKAREMTICRSREVQKRETASPGTFTPGRVQTTWMFVEGERDSAKKARAIALAANENRMPPQVLLGALTQESLLANLGIADDGGNFSCGIGQVNLQEWCNYVHSRPESEAVALGWPVSQERAALGVSASTPWADLATQACGSSVLSLELVRPFHRIAETRLAGLPGYKLNAGHFKGIALADVIGSLPSGSTAMTAFRFASARAFIDRCSDLNTGIRAKAWNLAKLHSLWVPSSAKQSQTYVAGVKFNRVCAQSVTTREYPLSLAWLLAVSAYNAGPRMLDLVAHSRKVTRTEFQTRTFWNAMDPLRVIESIFWGAKYNPETDLLDYRDLGGVARSNLWFKQCVAQRHIARVIQHVTLPGEQIARSFEEIAGFTCARSVRRPDGSLESSGVPEFRRSSSGVL